MSASPAALLANLWLYLAKLNRISGSRPISSSKIPSLDTANQNTDLYFFTERSSIYDILEYPATHAFGQILLLRRLSFSIPQQTTFAVD